MMDVEQHTIATLDAMSDILEEYNRAISLHGPMNSAHEGYAVLLEEVDELWDVVKMKQSQRDMKEMRKEAIQVAAMALKFIVQICETDNRK